MQFLGQSVGQCDFFVRPGLGRFLSGDGSVVLRRTGEVFFGATNRLLVRRSKRLFLSEKRLGRRIGYSQAKACSYADPAGPLCKDTKCKHAPLRGNFYCGDELATHRLKPARTPIQRVLFAERLESKCGALAGRPLKINTKSPRNQRTIQESGLSRKKQTGAKRLFLLEKRPEGYFQGNVSPTKTAGLEKFCCLLEFCRGDWIRTSDLQLPKLAR